MMILKWGVFFILRPISWFSFLNKVVVFSSANFGFNGQAKSNYNFASNTFGVEKVVFINCSGNGFGVPLKSFSGLFFLLFSKRYITDGVLPFFVSLLTKDIVQTWHGLPVKAIGRFEKTERGPVHRAIVDWLLSDQWEKYVAILSPSDSYSKIIKSSFMRGEGHNIYNSLLPQQFELLERQKNIKVRNTQNIKVVFYAPTYRNNKDRNWDLLQNNNFISYCEDNNIIIKVKYHPLDCEYDKISSKNIIYCENEELYSLLFTSDLVITDYSSLIYDCLILGKNLSLYCLDINSYRVQRGFADETEINKIGIVTDKYEFKRLLDISPREGIQFTEKLPLNVLIMIGWL